MTTPNVTAGDIAIGTPPAEQPAEQLPAPQPGAPQPPAPAAPETAPDPSRRRRLRMILAVLLGILLLLFLAFALWYLLFRKPITQLPIPNLDRAMPGFSFAAYDMQKPLGIAVSGDGSRIYVTESGGDQATLMLDGKGTRLGTLAPPADVAERATQLYVAVDPKTGDVYATDRSGGRVYIYTADGTYRGILSVDPDPGAWQPLGIAFDGNGNLYVADAGGAFQTVREIDRSGHVVLTIGTAGELNFVNGIAVGQAGDIYLSDSNNGRLLIFDKQGTRLGLVQRGPAEGELSLPRGIAADDQHRVYVVDAVGQSVQVYRQMSQGDQAPVFLNRFGREGTVDGAFEFPNGIAVDSRGRVYVADWNNDRIQVWSY